MNTKNPIRVIVAEDDFLVSKDIVRSLKNIGCEVIAEVSNGEDAVEKTCELFPDVVLMDIHMPKIDGLKASEKIQLLCPTPVVILTAHESTELLEQASKNGVGAYLTKPARPAEIERALTISIARHSDLIEFKRLYLELDETNRELRKALEEIKTLRGIIPICANCKKIRDDKGYWNQLEAYIQSHSDAEFSHGLCPECISTLYPDLDLD